jgi:hypothetical protein
MFSFEHHSIGEMYGNDKSFISFALNILKPFKYDTFILLPENLLTVEVKWNNFKAFRNRPKSFGDARHI